MSKKWKRVRLLLISGFSGAPFVLVACTRLLQQSRTETLTHELEHRINARRSGDDAALKSRTAWVLRNKLFDASVLVEDFRVARESDFSFPAAASGHCTFAASKRAAFIVLFTDNFHGQLRVDTCNGVDKISFALSIEDEIQSLDDDIQSLRREREQIIIQ